MDLQSTRYWFIPEETVDPWLYSTNLIKSLFIRQTQENLAGTLSDVIGLPAVSPALLGLHILQERQEQHVSVS